MSTTPTNQTPTPSGRDTQAPDRLKNLLLVATLALGTCVLIVGYILYGVYNTPATQTATPTPTAPAATGEMRDVNTPLNEAEKLQKLGTLNKNTQNLTAAEKRQLLESLDRD